MGATDKIREFLNENNLAYIEEKDSFYLTGLSMEINTEKFKSMPKMQWSMLAMEIGVIKVDKLITELEKFEKGAKIYEFRKKEN